MGSGSSITAQAGIVGRLYPERKEPGLKKMERLAASIGGAFAPLVRPRARHFRSIVKLVHSHGASMKDWDDQKILDEGRALGSLLRREGFKKKLVARCFALVQEVSRRRLGMVHFDVQLMGGWVLLQGMAAEMETGEGKTLTATLPASSAAAQPPWRRR